MSHRITLFVYGTLMPGQRAWSTLEPHVHAAWETAIPGRLYDTGRGYPAAVLGDGPARVAGWCCVLDDFPIDELDGWEGDEYVRVTVNADD